MFPGVEILIEGKAHIVPPLSIKQLREGGLELMRKTDELAKASENGYDTMELRTELVHMALQRNYPTITLEAVQKSLDLGNTVKVWLAVLGVSGMGDNTTKGEAATASALTPGEEIPATLQ